MGSNLNQLLCQMALLVTCMAQLVRNNRMYTLGIGEYEGKLNVTLFKTFTR